MQQRPLAGVVTAITSVLVTLAASGCSSTHSSKAPVPELLQQDVGWLCGQLTYDGSNPDYVPRVIRQVQESRARVSYQYEVSYNVEAETAWDLFNPFIVVGVPKSKDNVGVSGRLRLSIEDSGYSKDYDDAVVLDKKKFLFSEGDTLTEMRRSALIQLRDSIDQRLLKDRSALSALGFSCRSK
jgi:hypothetical protein